MENTGKVLFADDSAQWYISVGQKWVGPMLAADVYEKVVQGQIAWTQLVWKPGMSAWEKICDVPTFQALVPPPMPGAPSQAPAPQAAPPAAAGKTSPPPAPRQDEPKSWFLYYNDAQYGPFSQSEVNRYLAIGKIHPQVYAWRDGMDNWKAIEGIADFAKAVQTSLAAEPSKAPPAAPKTQAKENRSAPRKPLVARIMMADAKQVHTGVCRDISIGGMQVLTEHVPGKVGEQLKMNVSTPGAGSSQTIEPFVAEGVIVRILEDGRGFSFRFEGLNEAAKRAIGNYVQSSE